MKYVITAFLLVFLSGCAASYSNMTFQSTLSQTELERAKKSRTKEVRSKYAEDFVKEVSDLYGEGYELVGYSKFVAGLVPRMAEWNSRIAAKSHGASFVLLAQPQPAKMGQHQYLFTYWRLPENANFLFGAQYTDTAAEPLGMLGCAANMVTVATVAPGSPAAKAGITKGDVIAAIGESPIYNARQVDDYLSKNAGQSIDVRIMRTEESRVVSVELGTSTATAEVIKPSRLLLGVQAVSTELTAAQQKELGLKEGQMINGLNYGGHACNSDLRYGDLLLGIGSDKIKSMDQLSKALGKHMGQKTTLEVWRGGSKRELDLDLTASAQETINDTRRLRLYESQLENPPWADAKTRDFTWATVSALVVQGLATGYANHLEAERQRAIAYNQAEAQRLASRTIVHEGRNGRWSAIDSSGRSISIDKGTASLLQQNPGYTISQTSRRGNNFAVYNRFGTEVASSNGQRYATMAVTPIALPNGWYDNYMGSLQNKYRLDEVTTNQSVYGGPFNNAYLNGRR